MMQSHAVIEGLSFKYMLVHLSNEGAILVGVSLSEPHINGVSSRNHCIPMVQRTYVGTYVRNSNCKRYGKQLYTLTQI